MDFYLNQFFILSPFDNRLVKGTLKHIWEQSKYVNFHICIVTLSVDKIVIVMPAYNEAENIPVMIHELFVNEFPKIEGVEMHLLVVDDFSPDGTGDVVTNLMDNHKNLHLLQKEKEGLGWAYVRGMQYAIHKLHADAILEMD